MEAENNTKDDILQTGLKTKEVSLKELIEMIERLFIDSAESIKSLSKIERFLIFSKISASLRGVYCP